MADWKRDLDGYLRRRQEEADRLSRVQAQERRERARQEEVAKARFKGRFHCCICGRASVKPKEIYGGGGGGNDAYVVGYDWETPADLILCEECRENFFCGHHETRKYYIEARRCNHCKRFICPSCLHEGYCKKCAQLLIEGRIS